MSNEGEPRKLTDLRVVDLRAELEKRGLDKTGVKVQLIKKLQEALKEEGKDPDTYEFNERPKRLSSNTNVDNESDISEETVDKQGTITDKEEEIEVKDKVLTDAEDSINLTLEEDEDQLIDEAESNLTEVPKEDVSDRISSSEKPVEETEPDGEKLDEEPAVEENHSERVDETEHADQESEPAIAEEPAKEKVNDEGEAEEDKTVANSEKHAEKSEEKSVDESTEDSGRDKTAGCAETASAPSSAASDSGIAADGKKMNESDSTVNENATKQDKEDNTSSTAGRSLWLSGLATRTRATDLKQLLSKYGKVVGAKVVTNARSPSARCYGYVVMATITDADNCIKHCHRTELHGRFISVDKARSEKHDVINSKQAPKDRDIKRINEKDKEKDNDDKKSKSDTEKSKDDDSPRQRAKTDSDNKSDKSKNDDKIKKDDPKDAAKKRERRKTPEKDVPKKRASRERSPHRSEGSTKTSRDRSKGTDRDRSREKPRNRLSNERDKDRKNDVLSFRHIRDERDRQRERERERAMREAEQRRRREEQARQREIERKHREEAARLDKEREQLRIERERLQREKAELLRLERKRIEQEKLELQRQQRKLEESRRAPKRPSEDVRDPYPDNRKRPPPLVQSAGRYDTSMLSSTVMYEVSSRTSGPPESLSKKHDPYKRDEYKDFKSRELETRDRNDVRRDTYKPREDYSKLRDEYNKPREDVRKNREEVRSRETYSKHDRSDFAPPPPQISGTGITVKYSATEPAFSGLTRNVHEVMRRGEPLPAVTLTVRGYPERGSGPTDHRGSPPNSSYRSSRDERDSRRPDPEHRSGKDMVSSRDHRYVEMSSLKERENGWHQSSLKTFGSISGANNSGVAIRDPWLKNEGPISNNSNAWVPSGRSMDTSGSRWLGSPTPRMMSGISNPSGNSGNGGLVPPGVSSSSYLSEQRYSYKLLNNSRKY